MAISVTFKGNDEGARATAEALARSLDQLGISADKVNFNVAKKGSDNLYQSLRELKGEAVQHQRVFGFFGAQLAQTGLIARETGAALVGLGASLQGGMAVVAAVEALKLLVEGYQFLAEAEKKEREEREKGAEAHRDWLRRMNEEIAILRGTDPLDVERRRKLVEIDKQIEENRKKQVAYNGSLREYGSELGTILSILVGLTPAEREQNELVKQGNDLLKQRADIAPKFEEKAQAEKEKEAGEARKKAREKEAGDWRRFQDEITASGIKAAVEENRAEEKLREEARKKEEAELREWQKEMERIEGPEAERKGEAALQEYERKKAIEQTRELGMAADLAADAFSSIGHAIGGVAGSMVATFGKLITQAVQLAIAMSAELPPPLGLLNMAASAAAILATVASVPKYEVGTPYVPRTGLALLHQGERIVPASENAGAGPGGTTINLTVHAMDGASVERILTANQGALLKVLGRAAQNRRRD